MSTSTLRRRATARTAIMAPAAVGLALLLSACGSGSSTASNAAASGSAGSSSTPKPGRGMGVSGQITSVNGDVLQVQGAGGQQTVSYGDSTALVQLLSATESDLAVGKCVQVRAPQGDTAADPTQPVNAGMVTISDAVNGSCMRGIGGGGGGGRGGGGGAGASAGGTAGAGRARGGGVRGIIASVSGDTVTVTPTGGSDAGATPNTATRTVNLSSATQYSKVGPAASTDLTVGKCVTAIGGSPAQTIIVRPTCGSGSTTSAPTTGADGSSTASATPSDTSSSGNSSSTSNSGSSDNSATSSSDSGGNQ